MTMLLSLHPRTVDFGVDFDKIIDLLIQIKVSSIRSQIQ